MIFKTNFFYNDGATEGAGGATEQTTDTTTVEVDNTDAAAQLEVKQEAPAEVPADVLKELEELRAFKQANTKEPERTPEQIAKDEQKDKADFIKFSVENDLMNIDDLTKYESLAVKADADLVFESFLEDFKEENPDIEDPTELAEAAKTEFNFTYKLSSENEKVKAKGLAKLAKEAKEIRSPYETKVTTAKTSYAEQKQIRENMPKFDKFVQSVLDKSVPEKLIFKAKDGEEEIPVSVELTKEDKKEIAELFSNAKTYQKFIKSPEEAETYLQKKVESYIKSKKADIAVEEAVKIGKGIGVKAGSNAGADNPFPLIENGSRPMGRVLTLEESNEKIARARASYN